MKTIRTLKSVFLFLLAGITLISCEKDSPFDSDPPLRSTTVTPIVLTQGSSISINLLAGQTIDAGNITLSFDQTNLYVTYTTTGGWYLSEVHLWIGTSLSLMPQTPSGNPKIGNFPYKATGLDGQTSYQFVIPLSDLGGYSTICGSTLYFAAHASVYKYNTDGSIDSQTGWGEGPRITDKGNWATYFAVTFNCTTTQNPGNCETAFGYGDLTFIDAGLTNSRWGWIYTVDAPGTYTTPIYAGAGQNNISNGTHAGDLTISYDGYTLIVSYTIFSGYVMSETQLYASTTFPTTIAPGQFGWQHTLSNATSDTYSITLSGTPVYIIAHAVVCEQ